MSNDLVLSRIVDLAQWLAEIEREVKRIHRLARRTRKMLQNLDLCWRVG
jgi:hypothetical protein